MFEADGGMLSVGDEATTYGCLSVNFRSKVPLMVSYEVALQQLGERARSLRLVRRMRQEELALRAGVGLMTVRRFEKAGRASIENVLRIATALRVEQSFNLLFQPPKYRSLDEAIKQPETKKVQRVRK